MQLVVVESTDQRKGLETMKCNRRHRAVIAGVTAVVFMMVTACGSGSASPKSLTTSDSVPAMPEQVHQLIQTAQNLEVVPNQVMPPLADAHLDTGMAIAIDHGCTGDFGQKSASIESCTFGDPRGSRTLVLYGDSHAAMWLPAFDEIGRSEGWRVVLLWKGNCGAAEVTYWLNIEKRLYPECSAWHRWAIPQINRIRPNAVILASSVTAGNGYSGKAEIALAPSVWRTGLEKTLQEIASPGINKVVLGDIPYIFKDATAGGPTDCLAIHPSNIQMCSAPPSTAVYRTAEQQAATLEGAQYVDTVPWFCARLCTGVIGSFVVYADGTHITAMYIQYLTDALEESLPFVSSKG
jgi:hypothetical protein